MESEQSTNKQKIIATLAVLLVIVMVVAGAAALSSNTSEPQTNETAIPDRGSTATTDNAPAGGTVNGSETSNYIDGSYTATGDYISPGGQEFITVTVNLKDGKVTDTSAISGAKSREGKGYQADFIGGYESQVVGKNIDEVDLSRVSGSSLTPRGFNDALDQIRQKARG